MTVDDIALTLHYGLGAKGIVYMLSVFGSASAIFSASYEQLVDEGRLRPEIARDIVAKKFHSQAEREITYMNKNALTAVASTDQEYPPMLLECGDYPHVLYVKGNKGVLNSPKMLSMVGTRTITPYGQRMCDVLVGRAAELEPEAVIVSGLAFGVDANCHRAALRYGLKTIAVVANPLPDIIPSQHTPLAEEIVEKGGAIITELHSQTKQNGAFYIPRNRIVAGISEGTVVVESPSAGGALSTANLADGYSRIVMAVPGRADDRRSEGANSLIKRRKAAMVCSADDVFYELGWDIVRQGRVPVAAPDTIMLSNDEVKVLACVAEGESVGIDSLALRCGIAVGQLSAILQSLEIGGIVRSLPGKMYEKV